MSEKKKFLKRNFAFLHYLQDSALLEAMHPFNFVIFTILPNIPFKFDHDKFILLLSNRKSDAQFTDDEYNTVLCTCTFHSSLNFVLPFKNFAVGDSICSSCNISVVRAMDAHNGTKI